MTSTATLTESLTYAQLVAKIQANELKKGASYTITDFATAHYMLNGEGDIIEGAKNIGAVEPLTVKAATPNSLFKEAFSSDYPQDTIYYDWNPENWKYDLAFAGFDEEVLPEWKGVIFFRHDTFNDVSMGHDFRNVLNRRWKMNYSEYSAGSTYGAGDIVQKTGVGAYLSLQNSNTGNDVSDLSYWENIIDYSVTEYVCSELSKAKSENDFIDVLCFYSQEATPEEQYKREVFVVHLEPLKEDVTLWRFNLTATILQNNVFALEPNFAWYQITGINAKTLCVHNTFIGYQDGTVTGSYFGNNIIGSLFYNNTIGSYFYYNTIGSEFGNNTIGSYFINNTIGSKFRANRVHDNFGSADFTSATHIYAAYNCELFKRQDGAKKLSYVNDSDELVIVDATA